MGPLSALIVGCECNGACYAHAMYKTLGRQTLLVNNDRLSILYIFHGFITSYLKQHKRITNISVELAVHSPKRKMLNEGEK